MLEFTGLQTKMVRNALFALAVSCAVAAPARAQDVQGLRIVPLVKDGQVLVSMQLADGFTDEVRAAIRSGLKTTFTYIVDLRLDVPVWVDRTLGSATITSSVLFDNLERRFTLERFVDGRPADRIQTEDESVVRQWTTDLVKLPLFRTGQLETNRDYYVRVSATARPSNGLLLWPFSGGTSGQAKFTFIR